MGLETRDIALSIAGGYYISPPCYAIPHNCYIAGCYTAIFEAKNKLKGAILAFIGKWAYSRGAIRIKYLPMFTRSAEWLCSRCHPEPERTKL